MTRAVRLALDTLGPATGRDWQVPAHGLTWTCWETVEHLADSLFTYAAQLAPAQPSLTTHVPFGWVRRRPGGPLLTVFVDDTTETPEGLLTVLESCGGMLAAVLATVPAERMSFHNYGASDPSGFAAMALVEILAHVGDVAPALGQPWSPPADLCAAALDRLFPGAPDGPPVDVLLWATGRGSLPGVQDRSPDWTWDGSPR